MESNPARPSCDQAIVLLELFLAELAGQRLLVLGGLSRYEDAVCDLFWGGVAKGYADHIRIIGLPAGKERLVVEPQLAFERVKGPAGGHQGLVEVLGVLQVALV